MKTFVLIGGIGSGKSTVCKMLGCYGATVVSLDEIAHEVLKLPEIQEVIKDEFGEETFVDGEVNRKVLAERAFVNEASTIRLNNAVHPTVFTKTCEKLEELEAQGKSVVVIEVSAFDGPDGRWSKFVNDAELLIAVTAPTRQRLERATAKGFDERDVRKRIERQASDTQRMLWADYVLDNSAGLDELAIQAENLWQAMQD